MKKVVALLLCAACVAPVLARRNPYMNKGSDEYQTRTSLLLGQWEVSSYIKGDDGEQIAATYDRAVFEFVEPEKSGRNGVLQCTFVVSDSIARHRAKDYIAKEPGMSIESYTLTGTIPWSLSSSGDILHLEKGTFTVNIKGEGKRQLKNFSANEQGFVESASSSSASGTLGGMIGGAVMKGASGISGFFPEFPSQANPLIEEEKLELKTMSQNKFFLTRIQ